MVTTCICIVDYSLIKHNTVFSLSLVYRLHGIRAVSGRLWLYNGLVVFFRRVLVVVVGCWWCCEIFG